MPASLMRRRFPWQTDEEQQGPPPFPGMDEAPPMMPPPPMPEAGPPPPPFEPPPELPRDEGIPQMAPGVNLPPPYQTPARDWAPPPAPPREQGPPPMPRLEQFNRQVDQFQNRKEPGRGRQILGGVLAATRFRGAAPYVSGEAARDRELENLKVSQGAANEEQQGILRSQQAMTATEQAKAAQARALRDTATAAAAGQPKPIERNPENDLVVPDTKDPTGFRTAIKGVPKPAATPAPARTIEGRVTEIVSDPKIPEDQKKVQIKALIDANNLLNPEKPITHFETDDRGNVRAVSVKPSVVANTPGGQTLGQIGKSKTQPQGGGNDEQLVQNILDNPAIYDALSQKSKERVATRLASAGFEFGKPLTEGAIGNLAESKSASAALVDLRKVLVDNEQYIGPIAGYSAMNPWSEANKAQASIDRIKQRVGKALEGGVLRKEDEAKYARILAKLTDEPSTAIYKVDEMIQMFERDVKIYQDELRAGGRRVGSPNGGAAPAATKGGTIGYQVGSEHFNIPAAKEADFLKAHPNAVKK